MKVQHLSEKYLEDMGHRFKLIRTYLKFDQKVFAGELKTTQSQISKIEAGKAAPTLHHLLTIKKLAYQNENISGSISWSWLLEGKGNIFEE